MITLPNGKKWRLVPSDMTPVQVASYEPAEMTPEQFVDAIRLTLDERHIHCPNNIQRWDEKTGMWNSVGALGIYDEVFLMLATKAATLPFGPQVFLMPWGKVYVGYLGVDPDPAVEEPIDCMMHFNSWDDYVASVTNLAVLPQEQEGDE